MRAHRRSDRGVTPDALIECERCGRERRGLSGLQSINDDGPCRECAFMVRTHTMNLGVLDGDDEPENPVSARESQ